jgi:hypothetical protein
MLKLSAGAVSLFSALQLAKNKAANSRNIDEYFFMVSSFNYLIPNSSSLRRREQHSVLQR